MTLGRREEKESEREYTSVKEVHWLSYSIEPCLTSTNGISKLGSGGRQNPGTLRSLTSFLIREDALVCHFGRATAQETCP